MANRDEPKTRSTEVPVAEFLATVEPDARRSEADRIVTLMTEATGVEPVMWGSSIIGWGEAPLVYASGATLAWPVVGFSPRKARHTVYLLHGFDGLENELARLGPHTLGVGCLYLKRLDAIDPDAFRTLIEHSWERTTSR